MVISWEHYCSTININTRAMTGNGPMITVRQAARALDLDAATIRQLADAGHLPAIREGARIKIYGSAISSTFRRVCPCGYAFITSRSSSQRHCSDECRQIADATAQDAL